MNQSTKDALKKAAKAGLNAAGQSLAEGVGKEVERVGTKFIRAVDQAAQRQHQRNQEALQSIKQTFFTAAVVIVVAVSGAIIFMPRNDKNNEKNEPEYALPSNNYNDISRLAQLWAAQNPNTDPRFKTYDAYVAAVERSLQKKTIDELIRIAQAIPGAQNHVNQLRAIKLAEQGNEHSQPRPLP